MKSFMPLWIFSFFSYDYDASAMVDTLSYNRISFHFFFENNFFMTVESEYQVEIVCIV